MVMVIIIIRALQLFGLPSGSPSSARKLYTAVFSRFTYQARHLLPAVCLYSVVKVIICNDSLRKPQVILFTQQGLWGLQLLDNFINKSVSLLSSFPFP